MQKYALTGIFAALALGSSALASCDLFESTTAVLWTDRPEFAVYAEYFNSSQEQYKIEPRYFESPAKNLTDTREFPDIVVGSWLKSSATRAHFRPLDDLFKDGLVDASTFYDHLLSLGRIEERQYLLPVSFNLPALVFAQENRDLLPGLFVITLDEIKTVGKEYNIERNGAYTRMGFSPAWDSEFPFLITTLFDAAFREGQSPEEPLEWEAAALERAVAYTQEWITEANTNITMVDDFTFKYFYTPQAKLVTTGRILFTYLDSAALFTLAEEQRDNLDFRWIAADNRRDLTNTIPLTENTAYYGICKNTKAKKAAAAFTQWFYREDTQRFLLEESRKNRMNETRFGIAGGFSALRTVTEHIFPQYYPSLLGHMPPADSLSPPNILPRNWETLKQRVLLPYLNDRIRTQDTPRALDRLLSDWVRMNRGM